MELGAEGKGVVGVQAGIAGIEGRAAALVVSIDVRVGAVVLEIGVVLDAGRRAGGRGVVLARAAVGRVGLVAVQVGITSTLAANGEAGGIKRSLESRGAIGSQINRAGRYTTVLVIVNPCGKIITVDERNIIVVLVSVTLQGPFSHSSGWNTRASVGITLKTTVAAAVETRVGSRVCAEVAVTTGPNTTGLPIIGYSERN